MTTFAIGIVAHKDRLVKAWSLSQDVKASFLSVDQGTWGAQANHLQVWRSLAADYVESQRRMPIDIKGIPEWCVVLEDDAVPSPGFLRQLEMVLEIAPTDIVGLYLGTSNPPAWQDFIRHVQRDEANWIQSSHLLHGVGTALRTELVPHMIKWVENLDMPIDAAITEWCRSRALKVSYTKPSIVDHEDGPTLIAHPDGAGRPEPRKAWQFGTRQYWRGTTVLIP